MAERIKRGDVVKEIDGNAVCVVSDVDRRYLLTTNGRVCSLSLYKVVGKAFVFKAKMKVVCNSDPRIVLRITNVSFNDFGGSDGRSHSCGDFKLYKRNLSHGQILSLKLDKESE